jgi:hypothetical protein
MLASVHNLYASDKRTDVIVSARNHDLSISVVNDSGQFVSGSNAFCVAFTRAATAYPVSVKNVDVEFAQQVGRIQERPTRAQIAENDIGSFCGRVDFGTQNDQPASYYIFVRYTEASGTRRRCRFLLVIKPEKAVRK